MIDDQVWTVLLALFRSIVDDAMSITDAVQAQIDARELLLGRGLLPANA